MLMNITNELLDAIILAASGNHPCGTNDTAHQRRRDEIRGLMLCASTEPNTHQEPDITREPEQDVLGLGLHDGKREPTQDVPAQAVEDFQLVTFSIDAVPPRAATPLAAPVVVHSLASIMAGWAKFIGPIRPAPRRPTREQAVLFLGGDASDADVERFIADHVVDIREVHEPIEPLDLNAMSLQTRVAYAEYRRYLCQVTPVGMQAGADLLEAARHAVDHVFPDLVAAWRRAAGLSS